MQKYSLPALVVVAAMFIAGLVIMPYDENQQFLLSDSKSHLAILLMTPGIIYGLIAARYCYKEESRLEKNSFS